MPEKKPIVLEVVVEGSARRVDGGLIIQLGLLAVCKVLNLSKHYPAKASGEPRNNILFNTPELYFANPNGQSIERGRYFFQLKPGEEMKKGPKEVVGIIDSKVIYA